MNVGRSASLTARPFLSGIVVVERADRLAVTVCGSLLAELGATVLQVPGNGYDIGLTQASRAKTALSAAAGKTSIALEGREDSTPMWQKLVDRADVVLIGFHGPGDVELIERESARRIVCAVSAFGVDVPVATPDAGETVLQALGGTMAATGMRGGSPERANFPVIEMFTALNATTTILASLRTGGRGLLDIAGFDSAVAMLTTYVSTVAQGRAEGYRLGCGHHLCSPWNVYPAADGWIQLCSTTDEQWHLILRLIGREDLAGDPRFAGGGARLRNSVEVDEVIGNWTADWTSNELVRILLDAGLPVGKVRTVSELAGDPDLVARGMVLGGEIASGSGPLPASFLSASLDAPVASSDDRASVAPEAGLKGLGSASTPRGGAAPLGGKPLEGIRVVEIGPYTAGPLAGRYLADLGAEVIKVEPPGGEVSRSWQPQFGGHSGYFANCNAGKASVVLDLKSGEDFERFVNLVRTADVLVESLRPGALEKLRLGPADLLRLVPDLVYCSISGFGRLAGSRPALDSVVQAEAGLMWLVGEGKRPQRVGVSIADQAAAHAAPLLILAALRGRDLSGEGRHIDLSMQDILAWMIGLAWPDGAPALSPWATLAVADGWAVVSNGARAQAVVAQTGPVTRDEAVRLLANAGIKAAPVQELGEVLAHEAVRRRRLIQWVEAEGGPALPILSSPHRIGRSPLPVGRLPGAAGSDADVLIGKLRA